MIWVYCISIDRVAEYSEAYCRAHFPKRFLKASRYYFPEDRLRCIGVGVLLYEVLGLEDKDIRFGEYGKPYSDKISRYFSISHSGDHTVLAVSEHEIGTDIELTSAIGENELMPVGRTVFTDAELEWIRATEEPRIRFFDLWTLKESVSKVFGKGASIGFRSFDVLPILQGENIELYGQRVYGATFSNAEMCLSVCSIDEPCAIAHVPFDMVEEKYYNLKQ